MHDFLTSPLSTRASAVTWLHGLAFAGKMFHPDEDAADVINGDTDELTFMAEEHPFVNARIGECFRLLGDDIYNVALATLGEDYQ